MSLFKRQGLLTLWHHQLISPGANKQEAVDTHLETADVILLLVSANFLASDYCYGVEMKRALERHQKGEVQVIPILIRQVDRKHAPFAHLRVLPTNAKPLAEWAYKDAALSDVSEHLRRVIEGEPLPEVSASYPEPLSIWNVPYRRNPHFTGRDELLDQIHQRLAAAVQNDTAQTRRAALTQPQAIKGLGGIGKTQIAVEYAYRSRDQGHYAHTLWVNAVSEEALATSFVALAELLPAFLAKGEIDQGKLVEAIKRWLEQCQQRWLLIFDNADDANSLSQLTHYFPQHGKGSILVTTRSYAVSSFAASINVEEMDRWDGTLFLLRRAQLFDRISILDASDEEAEMINTARNIVDALDSFPLALDQAGAYIEETRCDLADYLQIYQDHRKNILATRGKQHTNYPDSVATTWSLSFQKVEQADPAAAELLRLCAFLAPDTIPDELIIHGAGQWSSPLQHSAADLFTFNNMMKELLKYSLVNRLSDNKAFSLHRLVQAVQMDTLEPEVQRLWAERAIRAVNEVFPANPGEVDGWPLCLSYLDQAQACNMLIEKYKLPLIQAAELLNRTAIYLYSQAFYDRAEPLAKRALEIVEQWWGPQHPHTARCLHELARIYQGQARHVEAEALLKQALTIFEQQLGPQHLNTARCLRDLSNSYDGLGIVSKSEALLKQALTIFEQQLGPQHLDTARCLHNLALLYQNQGIYTEAEPLLKQALEIEEQQLGPQHPETARTLNNLASFYQDQEKYGEAELLHRRALEISEQWWGPQHPDTASCLHDLALLYRNQEKYAEAEPLAKRALEISERWWGPQHPIARMNLQHLTLLYHRQGKYAEEESSLKRILEIGEVLLKRALEAEEQLEVSNHTSFIIGEIGHLASLYWSHEKYTEAEPLLKRALEIEEQWQGPECIRVVSKLNNLASFYSEQSRYAEAESLLKRALEIEEQMLGPQYLDTVSLPQQSTFVLSGPGGVAETAYQHARAIHAQRQLEAIYSNTTISLNSLACLYQAQGKYAEAEPLYVRAISITERQLEPVHPDAQLIRSNYATLLRTLGRDKDAKKIEEAS